ncbi:MAG: peptidoglycan bridge formation glycyltransferase FemA/FemB family protein [Verrucomicrobia bacterium]|nr:peptidoglycan bridge formation glycyltransferase FemA/FemB family protein [Verrucomicrobiota bacterium]MBI3870231.1 peptidoglycan bridge formation glycyltransferase FemA/FemB family protein [Verrucomicrobiota bacterium]
MSHAEPYPEQTSSWASVKRDQGWEATRICLRQGGHIIGGAQILEKKARGLIKVGYLNRGPLVSDDALLPRMVDELKAFASLRGYTYLAVSLPYSGQNAVPWLERSGFRRRPSDMPPAVWVRSTLILDLRKEPDQLFAEMSSTMRKHVRRSARAGVVVREGQTADLEEFCRLVLALCERRGVPSNMPGGSSLRKLWDAFAPGGNMKLFMAERAGRPLCGLMVLAFGRWARAWRIGWTGDEEKVYPSQAAYWAAIQWCQQNGFHHFDLLGVDERDATELLQGRSRDLPFHCSITQFKVGLGGNLRLLPGEFCYFPNRALGWVFNAVGDRLASHPWPRRLLNRLAQSNT